MDEGRQDLKESSCSGAPILEVPGISLSILSKEKRETEIMFSFRLRRECRLFVASEPKIYEMNIAVMVNDKNLHKFTSRGAGGSHMTG